MGRIGIYRDIVKDITEGTQILQKLPEPTFREDIE
jgi:hypothetical protein